MKIAVTGGAGFIASHIVDAYVYAGHEVVVIDDLSTGKQENLNKQARFVQMDITDERMAEFLAAEHFECLSHHAAQIDVRYSVREPKRDAQVNVVGSLNCIQSALSSGVKKIIFASSAGTVYGEQNVPCCDENQPTKPVAPYGVAKLSIEQYLYALKCSFDFDYVALRYSNVFGPRQNPHGEAGVIAIFLHKMLEGLQPVINGSGQQTRDYVFVKDVVQANVQALLPQVHGSFNICTAREVSVLQIVDALNAASGLDVSALHTEAKSGEQQRGCYDFTKATKEMSWTPQHSFEEGIRQLVEWERRR